MKQYSREEKMKLCKKFNQNRKEGKDNFEGFSKEDKLALAFWQIDVLDRDSNLNQVREAWEKWNKLAKLLIRELLQESVEVPTNKGMRKVLNIEGNIATLCKYCNGTGVNFQRKNNLCDCIRGWFYNDKLKLISEEEYKKRASKRYFENLEKKRLLSGYTEDDLLGMDLKEFLYATKVTVL